MHYLLADTKIYGYYRRCTSFVERLSNVSLLNVTGRTQQIQLVFCTSGMASNHTAHLGKKRSLGCQRVLPSPVWVALIPCIQDWVAASQHQPTVQEFEP